MSRGREYLKRAVIAHEHEMNIPKAAGFDLLSMTTFCVERNLSGVAEAGSHALIVGRRASKEWHLPLEPVITTISEGLGRRNVRIAQNATEDFAKPIGLYHAHVNLAKLQAEKGNYSNAIENYNRAEQALLQTPEFQAQHPSLHLSLQFNKAICAFKGGDSSALNTAKRIHEQLITITRPDSYADAVSKTGYLFALAECTHDAKYLWEAKNIIDAHPELGWRQHDWWRLARQFLVDDSLLFDQAQQKLDRGEVKQGVYDLRQLRKRSRKAKNWELVNAYTHRIREAHTRSRGR